MKRLVFSVILLCVLALFAGCAKTPSSITDQGINRAMTSEEQDIDAVVKAAGRMISFEALLASLPIEYSYSVENASGCDILIEAVVAKPNAYDAVDIAMVCRKIETEWLLKAFFPNTKDYVISTEQE